MEDILVKIREIIVDQFGVNPEEVTADMPISDLSADSLDLVEMVMALEETFDIEVDDEDIEGFNTVGDIAEYINDRM